MAAGDEETLDYQEHLSRIGVDMTALHTDEAGRVRHSLTLGDPSGLDNLAGYVMGESIGKGGMGVVTAARQASLGREVAIKELKDESTLVHHRERLVHEARVTGKLEHPNIVPVHDLGLTTGGRPMFVMKRIEGLPWSKWIREPTPEQYQQMAQQGSPLAFHLDVLIQVCHAVAYAHSRGFLHRDLKPANVMIGNFGEVYVVDWGIAISLAEASQGDPSLAGTPGYMAPEMAGGGPLDPRSDVFQLGAILYVLLTGQSPRREGPDIEVLARAWRGDRLPLPPDAPRPLARICERAMATDPNDRFGSVLDFQRALQDFIRVQPLNALVEHARARATAAMTELNRPEPDTTHVGRLANDARIALDQLRRQVKVPELERVRVELLTTLFDYEVERGRHGVAELLLDELGPESTERQRNKLDRLADAQERKVVELDRLRRRDDARVGARSRQRAIVLLGIVHIFMWPAMGVYEWFVGHRVTAPQVGALVGALSLAAALYFARSFRESMGDSLGDRTLVAGVATMMSAAACFGTLAWLRVDLQATIGMTEVFGLAVPLGIQGIYGNRRILPATAALMAGGLLALLLPRWSFWFFLGGVSAIAHVLLYWADEPSEVTVADLQD